ncbi:hypothetical protein [Saccharopolyspora phatthalungensis]|uniref:Uncharacterized protein n=1 Tax=Saccharopolyspora phatthalungensis TaxID=664693 RepID=A0A840QJX2_9PSEU|nr:hypothetical protein [Saccharopolyspora phatthalungensis]MBB5159728.1 hypothetical protein [Saccharopolyspora phatthalungensis]
MDFAVIEELRKELIDAIEDDWVYFSELKTMIRDITGSADDLLRKAGEAAAQLVKDRAVFPGTLTEAEGFTPWPTGPDESAKRIEQEVADLIANGTEPEMGDLCWFDLPADAPQLR